MSNSLVPNQDIAPVAPQSSKSELDGIIDMLELSDLQKYFMKSRWLEQLQWMEGKAAKAKKRHYKLRLTSIIGGLLIPIIISLNFNDKKADTIVKWISITLGGVVAISSSVEEFFHDGERWQHYRRTSESLKIQGWQFSQLSDSYQSYETHKAAFPLFVTQVENILQHDVEVYMTQVQQDKKEEKNEKEENSESTQDKPNKSTLTP